MKLLAILALAFLLVFAGCVSRGGYPESIYGSGLSTPAKYCISQAGDSDPKFYKCVVEVAAAIDNSSLCEEVFSESDAYQMALKRSSCIFIAEKANLKPDCMKIPMDSLRRYCAISSGSSPDACLLLKDGGECLLETSELEIEGSSETGFSCRLLTKKDCLMEIAVRSVNSSPCDLIERACDLSSDSSCRRDFDECFTRVGEITGDSALCMALKRESPGLPGYDPESATSKCTETVFNSTRKLSACGSLSGEKRANCIAQYAVSVGDPAVCGKIGQELKGIVKFPINYDDYLVPHGDWSVYSLCRVHDECLTNLAMSLKKPSICEGEFLIEGGSSLCFFETAISLNDSSLCGSIPKRDIQDSCRAQFKESK